MVKRYRGIKIALAAVLTGALVLPGPAAARGDDGWRGGPRGTPGGDQRGGWDQRQGGDWGRGHAGHWREGHAGRGWGYPEPRHHGYGNWRNHEREVMVRGPAYGWRPAPVIAPFALSLPGVTVVLPIR